MVRKLKNLQIRQFSSETRYSLVQFVEDNILYVTSSKNVTPIEGKLVWAPYKSIGYYEANLIATSSSRMELTEMMKVRKKNEGNVIETRLDKNENITPNENRIQTTPEAIPVDGKYLEDYNNSETGISSEVMNNCGNIIDTRLDKNEIIAPNENRVQANCSQIDEKNLEDNSEIGINSEVINNNYGTVIETRHDKNENIVPNESRVQAKLINEKDLEDNLETGINSEVINNYVDELPTENRKKSSHKRHCCFFCKKNVYQIVRHWETVHSQEAEVKAIESLHTSNPLRRRNIDCLRRKGDYTFNTSHLLNNKDYIVTRISRCQDTEYVPCPSCLGYFSKKSLRHHKQKCSPNKGFRHLQGNSRKLTYHIHEKASETLRNIITPDMFHDRIANQVFFDELLVIYGNYLCIKYTEHHLKNHIRAQLRLLGRFMVQVKVHNNHIKDCKELIHSRNIDTVRTAIDDIAELDPLSNTYKHPTNARTLLTELKKLIQVLKSESDKAEDDVLMKRVKGFSRRVKQELAPYINRVCKNSENKIRRLKQQDCRELPENENIGSYLQCLYKNISAARKQLEVKFSQSLWIELTQNLMVYLAVFNRKRPGETQRIEIEDFHNRECVDKKDLIHLDESEKRQANKYERIGFRGKLGNSTALLVDKIDIIPGINVILQHREAAGVDPSNRYLFAKPSKSNKNVTFDAYKCHKKFCNSMGFIHENFTFTKLRKHFATEVSKQGTSLEEERRISTYMAHDFNIHKKVYDYSATLMDITKVSKHLEGSTSRREHNTKKNKGEYGLKRKISETSLSEVGESEEKLRKLRKKKLQYEGHESTMVIDSSSRNKHLKKGSSQKKASRVSTDSSSSDEEPLNLEQVEHCIGKFRRRKLWSSLEKRTARNFFQEEILDKKQLELSKVRKFKELYKEVMVNRPIPMIKQWLEREKKKTKEKHRGIEDLRPRYSTPEKEILEKSTERHSLEGSEPSIQELTDLISNYDVLSHRTADSLLRKFRHIQQRKTRTFVNSTSDDSHSTSDN